MASIKPFAALRPTPELAKRICELPYDVVSSDEARQIAANNPLSFFHVSKPEIDLPSNVDPHAPEVYSKGKDNFSRLIGTGALRQDPQPCFYLYRQSLDGHTQTGVVAAASCQDYLKGIVKKHELTRPDKEDDRVRHIETLNSQTGPVFLVYRADKRIDEIVAKYAASSATVDFTAADGVRHTSWVIADTRDIELLQEAFARIPSLYIADGHHRCAAAARVCQKRNGAGQSPWFLSVIFPQSQVRILPYNRVLKDLNGLSVDGLLKNLESVFTLEGVSGGANSSSDPTRTHELGLYLAGKWRNIRFRPNLTAEEDPKENLDVTLLQKHVLQPVFGVDDPRTSQRINFVGGIRGAAELQKLVDSGEYACAFSLFPTGIDELMRIADNHGIMPPKSTWFEPKLRDAMFCHMI